MGKGWCISLVDGHHESVGIAQYNSGGDQLQWYSTVFRLPSIPTGTLSLGAIGRR